MTQPSRAPLVEATGLVTEYSSRAAAGGGTIRAVDGVDLSIAEGETLGLVGESGCGKSTLGRTLVRLLEPSGGRISFDGADITHRSRRSLRPLRRSAQFIFQDPGSALSARMTVGALVGEGLKVNGIGTREERRSRVRDILEDVGLPADAEGRYPHKFSGGQRQRIAIARALILRPRLVVADEPVSALDVSVQAQILNLLVDLKQEYGLTYLFIAHNLAAVAYLSDRIAVMYLGKIVEVGTPADLFARAQHPYTIALLSAIPAPRATARRERIVLKGDLPSPANPPSGCRFRTRCPIARRICAEEEPPLVEHAPGQLAACHFAGTPIA